jgi:adenine-specific DNA-methyltransferase
MHAEFFNTDRPKKKKELKAEIEALEWQLVETSLREKDKADKISDIKKLQRHNVKPYFLWKLHFNEVFNGENGGFDIVIANPPYIKEYENKSAFDGTRDLPYYQGKMDLWYFFGAMGLDLLKDNGIQCYIAPNNWVTNSP